MFFRAREVTNCLLDTRGSAAPSISLGESSAGRTASLDHRSSAATLALAIQEGPGGAEGSGAGDELANLEAWFAPFTVEERTALLGSAQRRPGASIPRAPATRSDACSLPTVTLSLLTTFSSAAIACRWQPPWKRAHHSLTTCWWSSLSRSPPTSRFATAYEMGGERSCARPAAGRDYQPSEGRVRVPLGVVVPRVIG